MPQTIAESAGTAAATDDNQYRQRSPVTHVAKLARPSLIHANTSDTTVRIAEVEHLVAAFQGAGKSFEHRIYQAAPGRHHFNRIDTKLAVESRDPMYKFLQRYLQS